MVTITPLLSNQQAEQVCLAAAFVRNPGSIPVQPDHFADPVHAGVFRIALAHAAAGQPITAAGLAADLGSLLDQVGGVAYLEHLVALWPTSEAVDQAAAQVRDAWRRRALVELGERLQGIGAETVANAVGGSRATSDDQVHDVQRQILTAALDALNIIIGAPATTTQAVEIGCAPDTMMVGVTQAELVTLADMNARQAAFSVVATPDRALGLRHSDLFKARADLFRQMAAARALP